MFDFDGNVRTCYFEMEIECLCEKVKRELLQGMDREELEYKILYTAIPMFYECFPSAIEDNLAVCFENSSYDARNFEFRFKVVQDD